MRSIAIIGGGPGGAHCARRLAEGGCDVSLFEPRTGFEKPCGGGVPARGLEAYPFLDDPRLPVRTVRDCRVLAPSGAAAAIRLDEPLYVFSRRDLHSFLLDRAAAGGARRIPGRVVTFQKGQDGAGRWLIHAVDATGERVAHGPFDFLVAADGAGGFARRRLAGGVPAAELTQAIGCYLPGATEDSMLLKFYPGLNGYLWVFPRTDHASAGICATLGTLPASRLRRMMDAFLEERYGASLLARSERYAALIPGAPADPADARLQGDGWALVGDTGRSVDPLTREGIYFAMASADLLADALIADRPDAYARAWRRHLGREFGWAARQAPRFFDTRFIERLVRLCNRSPRTASIMSSLIAGRRPYRTLGLHLILNSPLIAWEAVRNGSGAPIRSSRDS